MGDDLHLERLSDMPHKNSARVSPATVRRRTLQLQIFELHSAGLSWRKIAGRVGLSHEYCRRLYSRALNEAADEQRGVGTPEFADWVSRGRQRRQAKQAELEQLLALRAAGLSYRAIGNEVGRSKNQVQRMLMYAYEEQATQWRRRASATLGEELDRLDSLILAGQRILAAGELTVGQQLGAFSEIRKASEAKMRFLGGDRPGPFVELEMTRAEWTAMEVAEMTDERLDEEMEVFYYRTVSPPEDDQQPGSSA